MAHDPTTHAATVRESLALGQEDVRLAPDAIPPFLRATDNPGVFIDLTEIQSNRNRLRGGPNAPESPEEAYLPLPKRHKTTTTTTDAADTQPSKMCCKCAKKSKCVSTRYCPCAKAGRSCTYCVSSCCTRRNAPPRPTQPPISVTPQ